VSEETPDAGALHEAGMAAAREGRMEEAARLMERSVAVGPALPFFFRNLCEVYRLLGRHDEALEAGLKATAADPADALAHSNLSVLRYERLEPAEAIASATRAIALAPDLPAGHFGLAEASLLTGDLARGWEEYEWRWRLAGVAPLTPGLDLPAWDGQPLGDGRLLLVADQGFGDGIQFARFIPWAGMRCPGLMIAASVEMQPLIAQIAPGVKLFAVWAEAAGCAAYCPLSTLPRLAGVRLETIPAPVPYLRADPAKAAAWRSRLDQLAPPGGPRVGLVWAGRPTHRNDRNRSAALSALGAITDLAGVAFVALQKGAAVTEVGGYFGRAPLINLGPELGDFEDTLAVIDGLDLVITVDTAIAHLAGAAGRPVWVMLPHAPDWRWLMARSDSPWYPTMRLFRAPAPRDWASVANKVASALRVALVL
jgi:tetratricopeptide (TPR) repeat protein